MSLKQDILPGNSTNCEIYVTNVFTTICLLKYLKKATLLAVAVLYSNNVDILLEQMPTLETRIANSVPDPARKHTAMKFALLSLILVLQLILLPGCGTPGFPKQSYDEKKQMRQLAEIFEKPDLIPHYYTLTGSSEEIKKAARNEIIDGRLALIDLNYNHFIAQFSVTKESLDFGTEVTELGLNLATTAVGGASTKTILAGVASGVTGTKIAIDKNFFFEKTVPVLITSMNAQRKVALAPILSGITNNSDTYPLTRALADLDLYYFAGTFIGALQAIEADAGAKDKQAEVKLSQIRDQQFVAKAAQDRISAVLDQIDKLSDNAAIELEKNPPVHDSEIDKIVALRDPTNQALTTGSAAKQMLKMRAVLSGNRSEKELAAWEAAVKSSK
jgi:hypothetical protein